MNGLLNGGILFIFAMIYNYLIGNYREAVGGMCLAIIFFIVYFYFRQQAKKSEQFLRWVYENQDKLLEGEESFNGIRINLDTEVTRFEACLSFMIFSTKIPSSFLIRDFHFTFLVSLFYTAISLIFGWWGLPWGPINTIQVIYRNIRGGNKSTVKDLINYLNSAEANFKKNKKSGNKVGRIVIVSMGFLFIITALLLNFGEENDNIQEITEITNEATDVSEDILARYNLKINILDFDAVNSYPQRIEKIISEDESNYDVDIAYQRLTIDKPVELDNYDYEKKVREFLLPSEKIESDSESIKKLADSIIGNEQSIIKIADKVAKWTAQNIEYDNELAEKISEGLSDTQSALETLERKKGTCSEYTNVFIAMMRSKGIPARFVTGYVYENGFHAWAEIYLQGIGWFPVEAQNGFIGSDSIVVKLFTGKDYPDIGVKLNDLEVELTKID